ncbi:glycine-rich domain-containing protein [Actinokineospora sp. 24-640]
MERLEEHVTAVVMSRRGRDLVDPVVFARVSARLALDHPQVAPVAERIVDQALAFLAAVGRQPGRGLVPSPMVDLGWHQLILDTRLYARLCRELAGEFVHHVPDDPPTAPGDREPGTVGRTIEAITAAGFVVDGELWPLRAKCGPCHEDGNCTNSGRDGNENTDGRKKDPR